MKTDEELWWRLCRSLKARHFLLLSTINKHHILRKVASELGLSQPAVTKALQELEELFGAQLFVRSGAGVQPTAMGEFLIARSESYLQDYRRLAEDVVAMAHGYGGSLRIGVTAFSSPHRLTRAITSLKQRKGAYRFLLRDGSTDALVSLLLKKELDCVIGRVSSDVHGELFQEILYTTQPVLVTGVHDRARGATPKKLQSLAGSDWILPPATTPLRQAFSEMLVRRKIKLPDAFLETISVPLIAEMLKTLSSVVALVSNELADRLVADEVAELLPILLRFELPPTALMMRRGSESEPLLHEFLKALRA